MASESREAARVLLDELGPNAGEQIAGFIECLPTLAPDARARLYAVIADIGRVRPDA